MAYSSQWMMPDSENVVRESQPNQPSTTSSGGPFSLRVLISRLADFRGASVTITDNRSRSQGSEPSSRLQLRLGAAPRSGSPGDEESTRRSSGEASSSYTDTLPGQLLRHFSGPQNIEEEAPAENLGAAAERHRLRSSSGIDLQVLISRKHHPLKFT